MTEKDLTDGLRRLDSPAAREREKATRDLIRRIYGNYLELRALEKVPRSKTVDDSIGTISASLHQKLVDYLLGKKNRTLVSLGMIDLISYKYKMSSDPKEPPASERVHALSRNKIMFLFPSPIRDEPPFTVRARLSDLRRAGEVASFLDAYNLLGIEGRSLPEQQKDFVSRTIDELLDTEATRTEVRKSSPGNSMISHLRDLSEYLVVGRLLALNQQAPVPGLGLSVTRNGDRIIARVKWNNIVIPQQNYPAQLFHRPMENTTALIKAGVLFSDEVA